MIMIKQLEPFSHFLLIWPAARKQIERLTERGAPDKPAAWIGEGEIRQLRNVRNAGRKIQLAPQLQKPPWSTGPDSAAREESGIVQR